jgi:tetratricopeptide (TPR) repeat protein
MRLDSLYSSDQKVEHTMADIGPPYDDVDQEFLRSFDRLAALLREKRFAEAIEFLQAEIAQQHDPMARLDHMDDLAMVLTLSGRTAEALAVMRNRVELAPDEPVGWSALAKQHLRYGSDSTSGEPDTKMALETIDHAVAVAERTGGTGLRHCLSDRARIAKAIERWDVVEDTIRRILAIPDGRGVPDTAVEIDFLRRIPVGAVDSDLIERLRSKHAAALQRRGARRD